jgi:phosphoglycolate phosphatase-like HAD superfamily hydrolase
MLARSGNVDGFTYETLLAEYLELLPVALVERDGYVLPGVVELLDALQPAPVAIGLATGNVRAAAVAKLSHFSLWERFAAGGFGDDEPVRARLVESGLRALAAAAGREPLAAEAVVIGDTPLDIEAAHAIGARAGGVATGRFSVAELMAAGADWAMPDLTDTRAVVAAILGGGPGQ